MGLPSSPAVFSAPYSKAGGTILPSGPTQEFGHLRVGPDQVDGVELLGQRCFGKEGVELPVTGGAELGFGSKPASLGAGDQMVHGVPLSLSQA